jgi:hypothetical protein
LGKGGQVASISGTMPARVPLIQIAPVHWIGSISGVCHSSGGGSILKCVTLHPTKKDAALPQKKAGATP